MVARDPEPVRGGIVSTEAELEFRRERDEWHRDGIPVGLQEIAELLGVTRSAVDGWRSRGVLPAPEWTVGGRPAWSRGSIERWARETGRLEEPAP